MTILLFTLLFNALDAISDALYDEGHKLLSGMLEFILKAGIVLICLLWFKGIVYFSTDKEFWSLVISFALVRYAIFNLIYNAIRSLNLGYIGNTKLQDKILRFVASIIGMTGVMITQFISVIVGTLFILL